MADQQEEEDLRMALRMSMQNSPPEPKRSKPREAANLATTTPEESRRLQRELMAAAAEKRMLATGKSVPASGSPLKSDSGGDIGTKEMEIKAKEVKLGNELSEKEAYQLFFMVFGNGVSKDILAQWSNQGIRFSPDPETSMILVQHEGGPCGVLAAIQAFVLKHLLFCPDDLVKAAQSTPQNSTPRRLSKNQYVASNNFAAFTENAKARALVKSMGEILFLCGNNKRALIATLSSIGDGVEESEDSLTDVIIAQALEGLSIESASNLHKVLRVETYTTPASAYKRLEAIIPVFQSRMGALLFLISALLSRGLDCVQADRDDPSLPLVTAPFGHASQEIVNLLLCGQAVPNVFDGRMDLGGGMFLKGVSTNVEVGFLTLLESLNFYTGVQDENELEARDSQIRKAFDAQDQSGGGGFISVEGFHQVLRETNIRLPSEKLDSLCGSGFIVWSEFWQVILDLDKSLGGLKDSTGQMGQKIFDLYHFNGIAKSDLNGSQFSSGGETPMQRPRLTKLRVSVPPRWTPEEFMADVAVLPSGSAGAQPSGKDTEVAKPEPSQHAPLVDCIRTRWPRAVCNWVGDPPSIV
ncbi:hypothetical protein ERO13_D05G272200v2 [Gossypium hirsutum]|nr:hypothetical protein ERO13_D05G272200v2 [Gossypium hirsutum]